jgi:hypothetical protein
MSPGPAAMAVPAKATSAAIRQILKNVSGHFSPSFNVFRMKKMDRPAVSGQVKAEPLGLSARPWLSRQVTSFPDC